MAETPVILVLALVAQVPQQVLEVNYLGVKVITRHTLAGQVEGVLGHVGLHLVIMMLADLARYSQWLVVLDMVQQISLDLGARELAGLGRVGHDLGSLGLALPGLGLVNQALGVLGLANQGKRNPDGSILANIKASQVDCGVVGHGVAGRLEDPGVLRVSKNSPAEPKQEERLEAPESLKDYWLRDILDTLPVLDLHILPVVNHGRVKIPDKVDKGPRLTLADGLGGEDALALGLGVAPEPLVRQVPLVGGALHQGVDVGAGAELVVVLQDGGVE